MTVEEQEKLTLKIENNAQKFISDFDEEGELNYSEASLEFVNKFIEDQYQYGDPLNSEYNNEIIELTGSYILEVARRIYGGKYMFNVEKNEPILNLITNDGQTTFSIYNEIKSCLESQKANSILFYYNQFTEKVKQLKS